VTASSLRWTWAAVSASSGLHRVLGPVTAQIAMDLVSSQPKQTPACEAILASFFATLHDEERRDVVTATQPG
jgi:hypothetical protein